MTENLRRISQAVEFVALALFTLSFVGNPQGWRLLARAAVSLTVGWSVVVTLAGVYGPAIARAHRSQRSDQAVLAELLGV